MTTSSFLLPAAGLGTSVGCKFGWSNTRKKSAGSFWKRYPESYKEATGRKTHFPHLSASGLCGLRLRYLELWNLPAQIRGNNWESNQWKEDDTAGSWKEPGSLRHSLWAGQTQSYPLAALVYDIIKLSILLSYLFGSFLFLEAKDIPFVTGRVTPDHYHHPFYLVSKACNLQRTRTTLLPALWNVGYDPHLHVGIFRPRKSGHRLSRN